MEHQMSAEIKLIEKEIVKDEKLVYFYENLINKMNTENEVVQNIPLSQLDNKITIIKQLNDVKKDLKKKLNALEYMNKLQGYISKAKTIKPLKKEPEPIVEPIVKPIVDPIITPTIKQTVESTVEPIKKEVEFKFEIRIREEIKDIYNCLNILQSQLDYIMNRLDNVETFKFKN
jgi:hypothetical protein